MSSRIDLYRRAVPFWLVLAAVAALIRISHPATPAAGGNRLLAGIEPITVIKTILERPSQFGEIMLRFGLPSLARRTGEQDPLFQEEASLIGIFWDLSVGMRYHSPQEMLRAGLPVLGYRPILTVPRVELAAQTPAQPATPVPAEPAAEPSVNPSTGLTPAVPAPKTVLIFHTHTSESYLPISGREHLENGSGDIVRVGDYLKQTLESEGFRVVHDVTLNDQVPFRDAYRRSLATAERVLANNPDPFALVDLHRDATPGVANTIELGGVKVARLALIVGSDRLGLPHPNWQRNLAFANGIRDAAERLYPGLLWRVGISDNRYNQHLSEHAILVEVGNQYSTAVEVYRAAACLAKVLAEAARSPVAGGE